LDNVSTHDIHLGKPKQAAIILHSRYS